MYRLRETSGGSMKKKYFTRWVLLIFVPLFSKNVKGTLESFFNEKIEKTPPSRKLILFLFKKIVTEILFIS